MEDRLYAKTATYYPSWGATASDSAWK